MTMLSILFFYLFIVLLPQILCIYPVASDSTGQYLTAEYAPNDQLGIYYSSNYGKNFSKSTGAYSFNNIVSSSSGQILFATSSSVSTPSTVPGVYLSLDYGATWSLSSAPSGSGNEISAVTCDSTCKNVSVSYAYGDSPSPDASFGIYLSVDTGSTWIKSSALDTVAYSAGTSDSTGKYLAFATLGSGVHVSNDYGKTWSGQSSMYGSAQLTSITSDSTGKYLAGSMPFCYFCNPDHFIHSGVWLSTDYGSTWKISDAPTDVAYQAIVSDSTGQNLAAVFEATGYYGVYVSSDGGATWSMTSTPNNMPYDSIATDSSGTKLVVASSSQVILSNSNPTYSLCDPYEMTNSLVGYQNYCDDYRTGCEPESLSCSVVCSFPYAPFYANTNDRGDVSCDGVWLDTNLIIIGALFFVLLLQLGYIFMMKLDKYKVVIFLTLIPSILEHSTNYIYVLMVYFYRESFFFAILSIFAIPMINFGMILYQTERKPFGGEDYKWLLCFPIHIVTFVMGSILFSLKLLCINSVHNMWLNLWTFGDITKYEIPDNNDEDIFDARLFHNSYRVDVLFYTIPMMVFQILNSYFLNDYNIIFMISISCSGFVILNFVCNYIYYTLNKRIPYHKIPIGCSYLEVIPAKDYPDSGDDIVPNPMYEISDINNA